MSTTYFSWTFPLDPDATVPAANEINDLMRRVSDDYVCEFIASRGDWFAWTLVRMAREFGISTLDFFEGAPDERRVVGDDGGKWGFKLLNFNDIESTQVSIATLLGKVQGQIDLLVPFFRGSRWGDAEIRGLIAEPVSNSDDEGIGPGFFFETLHGLAGVLRNAQTHGQVVAHVRVLHH